MKKLLSLTAAALLLITAGCGPVTPRCLGILCRPVGFRPDNGTDSRVVRRYDPDRSEGRSRWQAAKQPEAG